MEDIIILNPDYFFKNDSYRILVLSKQNVKPISSKNWGSFIHPTQAIIFSFFLKADYLSNTVKNISQNLQIKEESAHNFISAYIENPTSIYTSFKNEKIVFPKNFLIKADNPKQLHPQNGIIIPDLACHKDIDITSQRICTSPIDMTFMLTNRCSTNCIYCYADIHTKVTNELPVERYVTIIEEAKKLNLRNIEIIGGEVFIKKDWDKILTALVEYNFSPSYISTKIPLNTVTLEKINRSNYANTIQFSLDSLNEDSLSKILGVNFNYLSNIKNSIKLADKLGNPIRITTILTRYNTDIDQIRELYEFISTLNHIEEWEVRIAMNSLYVNYKNINDLKADRPAIVEVMQYITENLKSVSKFEISITDIFLNKNEELYKQTLADNTFKQDRCTALNSQFFVLPDGKVTLCEQLYWHPEFIIGDLSNEGIASVWKSPRAESLRNLKQETIQTNSHCNSCTIFEHCFNKNRRCWVDVLKAYGYSKWDYPDPKCNNANQTKYNIGYE